MRLFKKSLHIQAITAEDMLAQDITGHIVYDIDKAQHYFFLVTLQDGKKQLLRFPVQKLSGMPYSLVCSYHTHDAYDLAPQKPTDALRKYATDTFRAIQGHSLYLNEAEIDQLKANDKQGLTSQATEDEDWYIDTSPLTKAQQQQLLYGQTTAIDVERFHDRIVALTTAALEACIRADDISDLSLTQDEQTEVGVIRYAYLNPAEINKFELMDKSSTPTLGDIHSFFVETIKKHILKKAPERADKLQQLQTLKGSGKILLGEKTPDFQNEGMFNPQGLSEVDDTLFRAASLILAARPDGVTIIVQSILSSMAFKTDIIENHLLKFLESLESLPNNPSSVNYIEVINSLGAAFSQDFYKSNNLLEAKEFLALYHLFKATGLILSPENLEAIRKENFVRQIIKNLSFLRDKNLLTQDTLAMTIHHKYSGTLIDALSLLEENGLLDKTTCNHVLNDQSDTPLTLAFLLSHPAYSFETVVMNESLSAREQALSVLYREKILTEKNVDAVSDHCDPVSIALSLVALNQTPLDTEKNRRTVINHNRPNFLAAGLKQLKNAGLFSQLHFDELSNDELRYLEDPSAYLAIVALLIKNNRYNTANRQMVLRHKDRLNGRSLPLRLINKLPDIASGLSFLDKRQILTQENFETVCKSHEPGAVAKAIFLLNKCGVLKENIDKIMWHSKLEAISFAFSMLDDGNLLNSKNIETVIKHEDPWSASDALLSFEQHNWFTPAQRAAILAHSKPALMVKSMKILQSAGLHYHPYDEALFIYFNKWVISDSNFELPAKIIVKLHELNILSPETLSGVLACGNPNSLYLKLCIFDIENAHRLDAFRLLFREDGNYSDPIFSNIRILSNNNKLFDQLKVINALHTFRTYIYRLSPKPDDWENKAEKLYRYAIDVLLYQADSNVTQKEAKAFAQKIVNKAQSLWGTDHQAARILLDVLLITLSLAGVGLVMIGVKHATTGHGFFYLGKQQERDAVNELTKTIANPIGIT